MDCIFQRLHGEEWLNIASSRHARWVACRFICLSTNLPFVIKAGNAILIFLTFTNTRSRWAVRHPREFDQEVEYWAEVLIRTIQFISETLPNMPVLQWEYRIMTDWIESRQMPVFTDTSTQST